MNKVKIYYAASIWGDEGDTNFNLELIAYLKQSSAIVLSEHLFLPEYKKAEHLDLPQIHNRDLAWVNEADVVIAECSSPSLGVGYEIREAVVKKKRVFALYKQPSDKRLSAMVAGSPGVTVINYKTIDEVKEKLKEALWSKQQ